MDSMQYRGYSVGTRLLPILPVSPLHQLHPPSQFPLFPPLPDTPLSKQTLPLKVFLVTVTAIFGLTLSADNALLKFEARQRIVEAAVRKEARIELAKRGLVPTETEIAKWREVNGK